MTDYGGLGGIPGGRRISTEDAFEMTIARLFGEKMREDNLLCRDIWSALANVDWAHENGDTAGYSFRAAGDLIAAIRGSGDYIDWYCQSPSGIVAGYIEEVMAAEGWVCESLEWEY